MDKKRQRKNTVYMSKRHLRRLAAKEADTISKILFHKSSSSCDIYSKSTSDLKNYYRINSERMNPENETQCENNNSFIQHENDNIFVQYGNATRQSEKSDSQQSLFNDNTDDFFVQHDNVNRQSDKSDSQRSFNISCDELSDIAFINENESDFQDNLAVWAVEHQITHTALRALLATLKKHSCFSTLSLDARTLLKTPRQQDIRTVVPGSYYHFGLLESLKQISVKGNIDCLQIAINIDGLPLTKSSQQQFWPILGSVIPYGDVFMIGLYHGNEKPEDANDFLNDFVNEAREICENGIMINGRHVQCRIGALICDTPAKSFVLCVKGHSGYSSCTKCTTEGEYIENRMCFPQIDAPLRTNDNFRQKIDDSYHKPHTTCSLLKIPYFEPVTNVPLDYMHLICLGIMRKLLNLWLSGEVQYRLRHRVMDEISTRLVTQLKPSIPVEFARKPRKLDCVKLWKATEYKLILLYTGPLAFKSVLKKNIYIHYMTLHVITRILSSHDLREHLSYAQDLIHFFIETFKKRYGVKNVSHNVHSLVHLGKDVETFGPLDNFSAFKFENYLQKLKKYLRKADKPLQQVVRRCIEKEKNLQTSTASSQSVPRHSTLMSLHHDGPLIANCQNPQYKVIKFNGMTLKAGTLADSCCGLSCGAIVCIQNVAYCVKRNIPVIIGHEFLEKEDLFTVPCSSPLLDIYSVHSLSEMKSWPLKNIIKKYVQLSNGNEKFAIFPLLHSNA